MSTILEVNQLFVHQGKKTLLHDINLRCHAGELIGIIGPNGAGKSTLLKCLSGYLSPSSGNLSLLGIPLARYSHSQRAKHLSYLPQHTEPAFAFLVKDVIGFGAFAQCRPIAPEHFHQIIQQLQLEDLLNQPLNQLSGGEQQRVHFARLLLQDADLMLLDEPTASLDIGYESQLMNHLSAACQQGKTALVAIHHLNTALTFCDRLILLQAGKLIAFDTPEKVLTPQQLTHLYHDHIDILHHPTTQTIYLTPKKR